MRTRIEIDHADVDALKSSDLWKMVISLFLAEGPLAVVEIADCAALEVDE